MGQIITKDATAFQKAIDQKRQLEENISFNIKRLAIDISGKYNEINIAGVNGKIDSFKEDAKKIINYFSLIKDLNVKQAKVECLKIAVPLSENTDEALKNIDTIFEFLKEIGVYAK